MHLLKFCVCKSQKQTSVATAKRKSNFELLLPICPKVAVKVNSFVKLVCPLVDTSRLCYNTYVYEDRYKKTCL